MWAELSVQGLKKSQEAGFRSVMDTEEGLERWGQACESGDWAVALLNIGLEGYLTRCAGGKTRATSVPECWRTAGV
jgi:hypothetical protein